MKTKLIILVFCLLPVAVLAQPGPTPGAGTGAGTGADTGAGTGGGTAAEPTPPAPAPTTPAPAAGDPAALRKTCTDAMNADPTFRTKIVEIADQNAANKRLQLDLQQHEMAAAMIEKNEKHVLLAYIAMWVVAIGFVLFLWRRQQLLKVEIAQLKSDLASATKDGA